jgi:hypothetical protein
VPTNGRRQARLGHAHPLAARFSRHHNEIAAARFHSLQDSFERPTADRTAALHTDTGYPQHFSKLFESRARVFGTGVRARVAMDIQ